MYSNKMNKEVNYSIFEYQNFILGGVKHAVKQYSGHNLGKLNLHKT